MLLIVVLLMVLLLENEVAQASSPMSLTFGQWILAACK
jgi:hypothetical protein